MEETTPDKIKKLLFQYMTHSIDEAGLKVLNAWREESARHEDLFQRVSSEHFLANSREKCLLSPGESQKEWEKIRQRTTRKKTIHWQAILSYAAVFLIAIGVSFFLLKQKEISPKARSLAKQQEESPVKIPTLTLANGQCVQLGGKIKKEISLDHHYTVIHTGDTLRYVTSVQADTVVRYNTLTIPKGTDYHLMLSDGTVVYLNTASQLRYPVVFNGRTREVELTGEGYFEVKRDPDHPFLVKANGVDIKVLGTSFNVRAYKDEKDVQTTLVEGSVQIKNPEAEVTLLPSQQAICNSLSKTIDVEVVNTDYYVSWITGRFVFNNTRLDDILTQLQKWYSFEVFYENKSLQELPFSLNIVRYNDFRKLLQTLEKTERVKFSIKGNSVVVQKY